MKVLVVLLALAILALLVLGVVGVGLYIYRRNDPDYLLAKRAERQLRLAAKASRKQLHGLAEEHLALYRALCEQIGK